MTPGMLLLPPPLQGCNKRVVAAVRRAAVSERQLDIENTHVNGSSPHRARSCCPHASYLLGLNVRLEDSESTDDILSIAPESRRNLIPESILDCRDNCPFLFFYLSGKTLDRLISCRNVFVNRINIAPIPNSVFPWTWKRTSNPFRP